MKLLAEVITVNKALLYTHKDIRIGRCPLMVRWSATVLSIAILFVWILLPQTSHSANLINGLGGSVGFGENAHTRNDDTPTGAIDITSVFPSGVKFGDNTYTTMYINNNGMVTFGTAVSSFTPNGLSAGVSNGSGGFVPAIALFWSDLDTRTTSVTSTGGNSTGSNLVYWDLDTGNKNITITWDDVAEFSSGTVAVISGQIVLHDAGSGDMDIKFIYQYAATLAGHTVTAGWNAGVTNGVAGTDFFEIPNKSGASSYDVLSDLASRAGNAGQSGIWTFSLRSGGVIPVTTPMVNSIAPVASGTALYGQTLSTTDGTWTGANHPPVTFTYQWYRASSNLGANAAAIAGATSSSYVIQAADSTKYLRATVIGHDGSDTLSANSNWIGPVPDNSVLAAVISNGTATPTSYSVLPGVTGSYTFDFATSANYHLTGINNGCGGTAVPSDFTYTNNTVGVTSARLTFSNTINTSCTVTASTALNASTITSSSTDNNDAAGVGGSISCPAIANYGTNPSCSFTPATGYHVYDVVVDGSSAWNNYSTSGVNTTQSSWSLGVTTAARTILVKFRKNTYLVTVTPGTNGSMSPATSYFDYGTTPTITVAGNSGYYVSTIGGTCGSAYNNSAPDYNIMSKPYTTNTITAPCSITSSYLLGYRYISTSVTPAGNAAVSCPASVIHGQTGSCTVTPSSGYHISGINGCFGSAYTAAAYTNGTAGVISNTFSLGTVTNDCTVSATVAINQYDITATPDTHSNISGYALNTPHTYGNINYNSSQSVTFASDTGYHLTGITNSCSGTASATYSNVVNGPWTTGAIFTPSGTITNGVAANCGISAVSAINVYSITPSIAITP